MALNSARSAAKHLQLLICLHAIGYEIWSPTQTP